MRTEIAILVTCMAQNVKRAGAFHKSHGINIQLVEEGTVAHRKDGFNKAVVFTEYPIKIGELFEVKIEDVVGGWAGFLVSISFQQLAIYS